MPCCSTVSCVFLSNRIKRYSNELGTGVDGGRLTVDESSRVEYAVCDSMLAMIKEEDRRCSLRTVSAGRHEATLLNYRRVEEHFVRPRPRPRQPVYRVPSDTSYFLTLFLIRDKIRNVATAIRARLLLGSFFRFHISKLILRDEQHNTRRQRRLRRIGGGIHSLSISLLF